MLKALLLTLTIVALAALAQPVAAQTTGSEQDSVTSVARLIHTAPADECIFVSNPGIAGPDTSAVFLGASGVTTTTGYRLTVGSVVGPLCLGRGQKLFGASKAAGDSTLIHTLKGGTQRVTP